MEINEIEIVYNRNQINYQNIMRKFFFILSMTLCFVQFAWGQKVTNVRAEQQGNKIVVLYDLSGQADVSVSVKVDGKNRPMTRKSGDVGKRINKGLDRRIVWDVLSENPDGFDAENVIFTVKASPVWRTFVLAEGAVSPSPLQGAGGLMIGRVARFGYYAKFRSSFMFAPSNDGWFKTSYIKTRDYSGAIVSSDINKLITGRKKNTELICNVGTICNFSKNSDHPMYIYLGVGYGMRRQMWEFKGGDWLKYVPTAYEGVSADFGMMFSIKNFLLETGVNTINFKYAEIQFGLGWLFNK